MQIYDLDAYQFTALFCAAFALFIIIQSLITFVLETYKRRADARRGVERLWNLPRGELLEPPPVVNAELPLSIGPESQPALEREEPEAPNVQPTVSAEVSLLVGAGREEPAKVQPTVSAEVLLPVGAEVQPALEREEPLEAQQVPSPKLPLPVGSKVWAVCNFGRVPEGAPGIITGAAEVSFFWQSPMYLCTFANNIKVRARPKDIEPYNHGHSLQELEQADFNSILSRRMTLRAQHLLSWRLPAHLR
jgi:hypothetical protein